MKIILDIAEKSQLASFMELVKGLGYVRVVKEITDEQENQFISDLAESFHAIQLHEQGKIQLKSAKDLLNELWDFNNTSIWT